MNEQDSTIPIVVKTYIARRLELLGNRRRCSRLIVKADHWAFHNGIFLSCGSSPFVSS